MMKVAWEHQPIRRVHLQARRRACDSTGCPEGAKGMHEGQGYHFCSFRRERRQCKLASAAFILYIDTWHPGIYRHVSITKLKLICDQSSGLVRLIKYEQWQRIERIERIERII